MSKAYFEEKRRRGRHEVKIRLPFHQHLDPVKLQVKTNADEGQLRDLGEVWMEYVLFDGDTMTIVIED